MDYHIVPNVTGQTELSSSGKHRPLHDWHFEAQLFGAGMLILLLPLVSSLLPNNQSGQKVLGAQTQPAITEIIYDSELGYYNPTSQVSPAESTSIFSSLIEAFISIFR